MKTVSSKISEAILTLYSGKATSGVCCPVLGSSVQDSDLLESPVKGHKDG